MFGWLFGTRKIQSKESLVPGRLEDVIALIQVLAMDTAKWRGDSALDKELNGPPHSGDTWTAVAKRHREFFRVIDGQSVILIARHYSAKREDGDRLDSWLIRGLIDAAIQMHQGQLQRKQILKATWIGGASGAVFSAVIQLAIQLFRG